MRLRYVTIVVWVQVILALPSLGASWWNSPYGPDDQIGAANLLTPELVMEAAKLIKTGKTYHLGAIVDADTPAVGVRTFHLTVFPWARFGIQAKTGFGTNRAMFNDDVLMGWLGTGSQIDGLGHAGISGTFYNGFNITDFGQNDGLTKLGIQLIPPMVTRGVLLNMAAYFGKDMLEGGLAFGKDDIIKAEKAQGVQIRKGDVVLFYTGYISLSEGTPEQRAQYIESEPGLGVSGAWYLAKKGVVAVGADTFGLEVSPPENPNEYAKVHSILIPRFGVYILEVMDTRGLVADGISEFLFVLGAPRIRGASQSIINPIAIA